MERTYIVSYPRSGSSWLRFILAHILYPDKDISWPLIDRYVPDMNQESKWDKIGADRNAPVVKNHHVSRDFYRKVIYLYRDGRDCVTSYYRKLKFAYEQGKDNNYHPIYRKVMLGDTFSQFLNIFIIGRVENGLFGDWRTHVVSWALQDYKESRKLKEDIPSQTFYGHLGQKIFEPGESVSIETVAEYHIPSHMLDVTKVDFICMKYEDMLENPIDEAKKMIEFLGWKVESKILEKAVLKADNKVVKSFAPRDGLAAAHAGMSGTWGAWKELFSKEDLDKFWAWAGDLMIKLGYEK